MPHFFLEQGKAMKPFEVHAGKRMAQDIILPDCEASGFTNPLPQAIPIGRSYGGILLQAAFFENYSTAAERDRARSTGFAMLAFHINNAFLRVDITPMQTPDLHWPYAAPEHQSQRGIHTLKVRLLTSSYQRFYLLKCEKLNALFPDGRSQNGLGRVG